MAPTAAYFIESVALVKALSRLRDLYSDMTILQAMCFLIVAGRPGIAQRELYRELGTTDSAASRVVALLSDVGSRSGVGLDLIETRIDPEDRRNRILTLTRRGERLIEDIARDIKPKR